MKNTKSPILLLTLVISIIAVIGNCEMVRAQPKPSGREIRQPSALEGKERLALVIGNGEYTSARKLANPVNDANDMAAALRGLGFEVISGVNLDLRQMQEKVRQFGDRLKVSGGVGLFYYAGHGV
jgi:hypothetical protein